MVFLTNCANGQNKYFNNKNTLGLLGGAGGGVLGNKLCKGCNKTTQLISTIGGVIGGMWLGSTAGEYFDKNDQDRQKKLIEDVLENNKDLEVSKTTYQKSWKNPNTGKQENAIVSQSAVPLQTYRQPPYQAQVRSQGYELPNGHPDKWRQYYNTQPNQYNKNRNNQIGSSLYSSNHYETCRELEVSIRIDSPGAPPSQNTFYRACRTEQGWKLQ